MIEEIGKDIDGIEHIRISGDIGVRELFQFVEFINALEVRKQPLVALYDFRDASVKLSIEELDQIKIKSKATFSPDSSIRCAFLTSSPEQAAFGIYYKLDNLHNNIQREVFTHFEAAMAWLKEKS